MPRATKSPPQKNVPASARERLLDAAAVVFARDGLAAATTREIAQAAGVNEVTIFRLFKNKQNLLSAVLKRVFAGPAAWEESPGTQAGLPEIVRGYAAGYAARLGKNLSLMRVLIGEIQHFQKHELMVIRGIFRPERQKLIDRLRAAQKAGLARKDVNPVVVADQLGAMVFMGALKSELPLAKEYSDRDYMESCVETIVRTMEIPEGKRRKP